MAEICLRSARPDEAAALSALALRSKGHWGYDDEFLDACRDELTVHRLQIEAGAVVVAEQDGVVTGFSHFVGEPPLGEVYMLFVEPELIGSGVGAALFTALCDAATEAGFTHVHIESDPNAAGFYERHGAVRIDDVPSVSIPGRTIPLLELDLTTR